MSSRIIYFSAFLLFSFTHLHSQKLYRAEGSWQARWEANETREQAYDKVIQLAIVNAIESTFGKFAIGDFDMRMDDAHVNYNYIAGTRTRGIWVETTKGPFIKEFTRVVDGRYGKENETWLECTIEGMVKECVGRANIEFSALNCPKKTCRQTAFNDRENLYLYFRSPVDGHLSVFLEDIDTVYRLLPYVNMEALSTVSIKGDKEYIFFSRDPQHEYDTKYLTDRIILPAKKDIEYHKLHILFSDKNYYKPNLSDTVVRPGEILPRSMTTREFQKWLSGCRVIDGFQDDWVKISVEKK